MTSSRRRDDDMARGAKPGPTKPRAEARKRRPGLPKESSIVAETEFTSPKGTKYRVLRTNEKDAYDDGERLNPKRSRRE
jgi:hypothetical protein